MKIKKLIKRFFGKKEEPKIELALLPQNHQIIIEKQKIDDFYVSVTDERGMHAVHGGFGGDYCTENIKTIEDCLVMCITKL